MSLDLKRQLVAQLVESSRLLRNYIDHRAKGRGTTRAQWIVLFRLRQQEGLSQVDLADMLELQPISLVRLLDVWSSMACWSAAPIPEIAVPPFVSDAGGRQLSMISTACATPSLPTFCKIFPAAQFETGLETLQHIKERIKNFAEPPGSVAAK